MCLTIIHLGIYITALWGVSVPSRDHGFVEHVFPKFSLKRHMLSKMSATLIWFWNGSLPMCMFANGFMGRTFLRKVPNKKCLETIVQKLLLKTLPRIQTRKKNKKKKTTHGDFSEVLAWYKRLSIKQTFMVEMYQRIFTKIQRIFEASQ